MVATPSEYARMSAAAYESWQPGSTQSISTGNWDSAVPAGFSVDVLENSSIGFSATIFKKSDVEEYVISYRGTDDFIFNPFEWKDWETNILLGLGFWGPQVTAAVAVVKALEAALNDPNAVITFTGHSLGGALAAIMAVLNEAPAVVFAPAPYGLAISDIFLGDPNFLIKLVSGSGMRCCVILHCNSLK